MAKCRTNYTTNIFLIHLYRKNCCINSTGLEQIKPLPESCKMAILRQKTEWVNDLLKENAKSNTTFKAENQEISNPEAFANKFCQYFSSIGPNLVKGIRSSTFLSGAFNQSIFLDLHDNWRRNYLYCKSISIRYSSSWLNDNIPMSIIKQSINYISALL